MQSQYRALQYSASRGNKSECMYLNRLVQNPDVVSELEGHSQQYDETQPYQIERQMLPTTSAKLPLNIKLFRFNSPKIHQTDLLYKMG